MLRLPTQTDIVAQLLRKERIAPLRRHHYESVKPRLLVVDDAAEITDLLSAWLSDEFEVVTATSGLDAIAAATYFHPVAVLLDVVLPDLNGFQVVDAIRQHSCLAQMPIIFMTGLCHPENDLRAVEIGAFDVLHKPLDEEILRDRIRSAVERRH